MDILKYYSKYSILFGKEESFQYCFLYMLLPQPSPKNHRLKLVSSTITEHCKEKSLGWNSCGRILMWKLGISSTLVFNTNFGTYSVSICNHQRSSS